MSASERQLAKRQQRVEELCAASLRALTGNADLHYRGGQPHQGMQRVPLFAPHLRVDCGADDFSECRGAADATALRLLHSDPLIHAEFCPANDDRIARLVFEWLEQMRVESLVPEDMPGMRDNVFRRFSHWSRDFHRAGLTQGTLGILMYTAAQMCWSRLTAQPVLEETEDFIEGTRFKLARRLGDALADLRRWRHDQRAFAPSAVRIARVVSDMAKGEQAAAGAEANTREAAEEQDSASRFALLLEFDQGDGAALPMVSTGDSKAFTDAAGTYRAFTTRYDTEVDARSLVRPALLREYREQLDRRVAAQGINISRLARLLRALLAEPARDGWLFGEESGVIDGRRLAQLISSPTEHRIFRQDRTTPVSDCLVTILVDCSGSMKAHSEAVATLADILLRALEMAGVSSELLGFTTGAWNGGRAMRDWTQLGRPAHPGRLNEVSHLVLKSADCNWRKARASIAALLKQDLFREGVDGEAVDWACQRMLARSATRRILLVVSDGCPNDGATGLANDTYYLASHLKDVVARREREGQVEIMGLGVGLDLSPFYLDCLATDMTTGLDNALFYEVVQLMDRKHRH